MAHSGPFKRDVFAALLLVAFVLLAAAIQPDSTAPRGRRWFAPLRVTAVNHHRQLWSIFKDVSVAPCGLPCNRLEIRVAVVRSERQASGGRDEEHAPEVSDKQGSVRGGAIGVQMVPRLSPMQARQTMRAGHPLPEAQVPEVPHPSRAGGDHASAPSPASSGHPSCGDPPVATPPMATPPVATPPVATPPGVTPPVATPPVAKIPVATLPIIPPLGPIVAPILAPILP